MSTELTLPIKPYSTGEFLRFGQKIRRHIFLWATHLGDDVAAEPGTPVRAIGDGEVVASEIRRGSAEKRNWGGVVVLKHNNDQNPMNNDQSNPNDRMTKPLVFYSIYGHMKDLQVRVGDSVKQGDVVGSVAEGLTPENGWWKHPHLHFAIYTGPWTGDVLPGYKRPEEFRTKFKYWHNPQDFIARGGT